MRQMTVLVAALLCVWCVACKCENKGQIAACSQPLSEDIPKSCVVSPGVLWRGKRPNPAGAASLVSLGVRTVVNLELLHNDMKAFQGAPAANVLSVDYFHIREWEPNTLLAALITSSILDSHVAEFLAIVTTQPRPIYVHCRCGQDRTGVMVAAYRVLIEGWSPESAIDEMAKYKGFWFCLDKKYINSLKGKHRDTLEALIQAKLKDVRPTASLTCSVKGCEEVK